MNAENRTEKPHIVILGAGPAGLGAAYRLAKRGNAQVTVLEQNGRVGGNAGSFVLAGVHVDYGSHRLHPACDPNVFSDIQNILGDDLLDRPRHGRIRLRERWIHFPLKPIDLALRLPPGFAFGVVGDMVGKFVSQNGRGTEEDSFASVMERGLGSTICRDFYFPYARKIWGMEPSDLSATQARRRVKNSSLGKMIKKISSAVPGLKPQGSGRFYYPRQGYGQISDAYYDAAQRAGVKFHLGARVKSVVLDDQGKHTIQYEHGGMLDSIRADFVWSTIPITLLARMMTPQPPVDLLVASERIEYRAMILIYLVIAQEQFSEYDAHYFPEAQVRITRLSEPKNYSAVESPSGCTVLCAELPCSTDSPEWQMSEEELGNLVLADLVTAGIPVQAPVSQVVVRKIRNAYPIYQLGYEQFFDPLCDWLEDQDGILTFGRQGLFAHDNTHHALFMAYSAVSCLNDQGEFDRSRWQEYRRIFETHVVED